MYYDDHVPPHFHAYYGDFEALIEISTVRLSKGKLPPKALGMVVEWATLHQHELAVDWDLALQHLPLNKIDPLE